MVTRVCVLQSGKEYRPEHVQWLARQVPGLVCITRDEVPGVPTVRPRHDWPGWWSKLNLFDPELIPGDLLYLDLDTVVPGDLAPLEQVGRFADRSIMLSDFYRPAYPASGLMYIKQADKPHVWAQWLQDPAGHMRRCVTTQHWGDQGFLRTVLSPLRWQTLLPGAVLSYKAHLRNQALPKTARVVCFHGQPRPWAVKEPWVPT